MIPTVVKIVLLALIAWSQFQVLEGKASFYGGDEDPIVSDGQMMASGYRFDQYRLEAAHKELPFGTVVLVRNMKNDKRVKVVITDRGPYIPGRIIDLTPSAAKEIDMTKAGVIPVKVMILRVGPCKTYGCYKKYPYRRGEKVNAKGKK